MQGRVVARLDLKPSRLIVIALGSGLVGAVLGATLVGLALFAGAFLQLDDQTFSVWLENDSATALELRQCADDCTTFHDETRLRPGERVAENTVVDVPNWWRVDDQSGRTLGCLPLLFGRKQDGATVRTSQVQGCPP